MHVRWSTLKDKPVGALEGTRKIGVIGPPIFNAENGTLLGCWVHTGIFSNKVLPWNAVREIDERGVVTASINELVEPSEVIRIEEALKARRPILGQRAIKESGERVGSIVDVSIDPTQGMLSKLHVKGGLGTLDVPRSKIVEVRVDAVVIETEEKVKEPALAEAEPA